MAERSCKVCGDIFTGKWVQTKRKETNVTRKIIFTGSRSALAQSRSCLFCAQIRRFLENERFQKNVRNLFGLIKPNEDLIQIELSESASGFRIRWAGHNTTHFMTLVADDASLASFLIPRRPQLYDYASQSGFSTMREWVHECDTEHGDCFRPSSFCPRILIDVEDARALPNVRLKRAASLGDSLRYIALSYCWGTDPKKQLQTTSKNVARHMDKIELSKLSKTIQDAVKVARELDCRYLWVDALCIIQDDLTDKLDQMAMMGDIYSHAYLTVSAISAKDCNEGFLHMQDDPYIPMRYRWANDQLLDVRVSQLGGEPMPRCVPDQEPLNKRGWTLQETALSPRILFFSGIQPYWKCQRAAVTQGEPSARGYFNATDMHGILDIFSHSSKKVKQPWHSIAENYSRRKVSNPDDKMPAVSQIAAKYAELSQDTYLAGLWRNSFAEDLLWSTDVRWNDQEQSAAGPAAQAEGSDDWKAPSWSWLSTDNAISYSNLPRTSPIQARFESTQIDKLRSDVFGRITSTPLKVKGRLITVLVPRVKGQPWRNQSLKCYSSDAYNFKKKKYSTRNPDSHAWQPLGEIVLDEYETRAREYGDGWESLNEKLYNGEPDPIILPCLLVAQGGLEQQEQKFHDGAHGPIMAAGRKGVQAFGLILSPVRPGSNQCRRIGLFVGTGFSSCFFTHAVARDVVLI